jgi:hypothetical protein
MGGYTQSIMRMGRSDAIDLFRKWSDEQTPIRWQGSFGNFAFGSWGYVLSPPSEIEIRVTSQDRRSELVIRLASVIEYDYADSRTVTAEEKKFKECVVLAMKIPQEGDPDTIALAALDVDALKQK